MSSAAKDWFRKTTWSESDQAKFFARLQRSRSAANKAQNLRIQAHHLEEAGAPKLLDAALNLLEKVINEFPATFELAQTYTQKASCLAKLGKIHEAIIYYRLAIETEKKFPQWGTRSWISFGRVVVDNGLIDLFDEVLHTLDSEPHRINFPADVYEKAGIRAIITAHQGNSEIAKKLAASAVEAATQLHSGFRYHPTVGLVRNKETRFYKSIQAIAETGTLK